MRLGVVFDRDLLFESNDCFRFGKDVVDLKGPIPDHLLGSMWAESWANLGTAVNPYPSNPGSN